MLLLLVQADRWNRLNLLLVPTSAQTFNGAYGAGSYLETSCASSAIDSSCLLRLLTLLQ